VFVLALVGLDWRQLHASSAKQSVSFLPFVMVAPGSGQASLTAQVAALSDDANQDGSNVSIGAPTLWVGNAASPSSSYTGLRFTNLAIPRGTSISSAQLQVYSSQLQWQNIVVTVAGEASGNSQTFTLGDPPAARALTAHSVANSSNSQWQASTWYSVAEIAPVVQEIVNRADWQSGNSLSLIVRGAGSAWGRKYAVSYSGSAASAPRLVIRFGGGVQPTSTPAPNATPTSTRAPKASATTPPGHTATPVNTATAAPSSTPPPPSPTAVSGVPVFFPIGVGESDVVPHQIVRAANDRLYVFAGEEYSDLIRAYWTGAAGLPNSSAAFNGAASVSVPAVPISVDAVGDGGQFIHVLANLNNGELRDYPFNINSGTFGAPAVLASGGPTLVGDYIGSSGLSAMLDRAGTLHLAYWAAGGHILYRAYSVNTSSGGLSLTSGPTQVDTAGLADHPALAVSPADGSLTVAWVSQAGLPAQVLARTRSSGGAWGAVQTVSTAPVWTSINFGLNIDQGPSLLIDGGGTRHLTYIENYDSSGQYGRIHYATSTGAGWTDSALSSYSHDPALALDSAGNLTIIGHGHPSSQNTACTDVTIMCFIQKTSAGWGSQQVLAMPPGGQSFDASPSVKWSVVGWNRPETVEFLFFMTPYSSPTLYYGRLP